MENLFNTIITYPLYNILVFLFVLVKDMGLAIILLTILVRLLLVKQSFKAEKARLKMQKIQPEIEEIKKKHKDNQEAQAKEMMALYQKKGINPFSFCGSFLIQMPFLIGLFIVFNQGIKNGFPLWDFVKNMLSGVEISHISFGILDLTAVPNAGWLLILPLLATLVQFIQAKMMSAKAGLKKKQESPEPNTNPMANLGNITLYLLPGITLIFTLSWPSALSVYWITTTLFAIGQQVFIDKFELKKEVEEAKQANK